METVVEKVIHLQNVELFAEIPTEQLSYIASIAKPIELSESDVLFSERENSDALHILFDGTIDMVKNNEPIFTVRSNETVGALGFFDQQPRIFTAVCNENCRLLEIDSIAFFDLLEERIHVARYLLKFFVKKLRHVYDNEDKKKHLEGL